MEPETITHHKAVVIQFTHIQEIASHSLTGIKVP